MEAHGSGRGTTTGALVQQQRAPQVVGVGVIMAAAVAAAVAVAGTLAV
jgi:hypothetical protein